MDKLVLNLYLNDMNLNSQTNFKRKSNLEDLHYLTSRLATKLHNGDEWSQCGAGVEGDTQMSGTECSAKIKPT